METRRQMISGLPPRLTEAEENALAASVVAASERMRSGDPSAESEFIDLRNVLVLGIAGRYGQWLAKKHIPWCFSPADAIQMAFLCSLEGCDDPDDLIRSIKRGVKRGISRHGRSEKRYRRRNRGALAVDPSGRVSNFEERTSSLTICEQAQKCLDLLPDSYAEIFRLRFGFDTGQPLGFDEIGERLGMSEVAAIQAYESAIVGLRYRLRDSSRENPSKIMLSRSRHEAKRQRVLDAVRKIQEQGETVSNSRVSKVVCMHMNYLAEVMCELRAEGLIPKSTRERHVRDYSRENPPRVGSKGPSKIDPDVKRKRILEAVREIQERGDTVSIPCVSKVARMYTHDVMELMREMRAEGLIPEPKRGSMSRIRRRNRDIARQAMCPEQVPIQEIIP